MLDLSQNLHLRKKYFSLLFIILRELSLHSKNYKSCRTQSLYVYIAKNNSQNTFGLFS